MLSIEKVDNNYLYINTDDEKILKDIYDEFSYFVEGYKFSPLYRKKLWDGMNSTFNVKNKTLLYGNLYKLVALLKRKKIEHKINIKFDETDVKYEHLFKYFNKTPRKYQIDSLKNCLKKKRLVSIINTGGGKSGVIWLLVCWMIENKKPTLIVVPRTQLVYQLYDDFCNYYNNESVGNYVTKKIGSKLIEEKLIIISTWKTLVNQPKEYFNRFETLIVDECHLAKDSKSYNFICKASVRAENRFGFTGTLVNTKIHRNAVEGLLGRAMTFTDINTLIEEKALSPLEIEIHKINYDNTYVGKSWHQQCEELCYNKVRNMYVTNLAKSISKEKNTLILVNLVEHGKELLKLLESTGKAFMVYGEISQDERKDIIDILNSDRGFILIATYGSFSTGINITGLDNLILGSSTKSEVRLYQSIGRILRLDKRKDIARVYDIIDDIIESYFWQHGAERRKMYASKGLNFTEKYIEKLV